MIGYVFLSSGAMRTSSPERYPARQDQIENVSLAMEAVGGSPEEMTIVIEKSPQITGLRSLPKLARCLAAELKGDKQVFIDDMRRVFYSCPIAHRRTLFEEIWPFAPIIFEVARSGSALSTRTKSEMIALLLVDRPVRYRAVPKERLQLSESARKRQTRIARYQSARSRAATADRKATQLNALKSEMLATQAQVTNKALADEANERGLKTTRGNDWTPATVKRTLDRLRQADRE
jgi:hypothetical protein